jgi:glutamine amidotransferase
MCRFIAYLGKDILLSDILIKPVNSIIKQSVHARESTNPTNGDGFGLGWYKPSISPEPALFTSISPAWNDQNLEHLSQKTHSPVFFAHVRAASAGGVTHYNCHPFIHNKWMFMHNGGIHDFTSIKRHLRRRFDDDIYHWVKGQTDSEHLFGLILQLAKKHHTHSTDIIAEVILEALQIINELQVKYGKPGPSFYNFCLTDGKNLIATRYCTHTKYQPETLHYSETDDYTIVSSEKLTNIDAQWNSVSPNHILTVEKSSQGRFIKIT